MENNKADITITSKIKEIIKSRNFRISIIAATIGSVAGFLYYYLGEIKQSDDFITSNALLSVLWGGLLGVFVVNSPCSRGRC
jgi:hypothetical protein